jgi:hypothetical protein
LSWSNEKALASLLVATKPIYTYPGSVYHLFCSINGTSYLILSGSSLNTLSDEYTLDLPLQIIHAYPLREEPGAMSL